MGGIVIRQALSGGSALTGADAATDLNLLRFHGLSWRSHQNPWALSPRGSLSTNPVLRGGHRLSGRDKNDDI